MKGRYYNIHVTRFGQHSPDPTPVMQVFAATKDLAKDSANKTLRAQGVRKLNLPRTCAQ
jgi:hypothetical protein